MTIQQDESMLRYMLLGACEVAFNRALTHDPEALEMVSRYVGHVIKIKVDGTGLICFVVFCPDGVQLFWEHEGPVHARIRGPATQLMSYFLGPSMTADPVASQVRITGDAELIRDVIAIAEAFNLWQLCKSMLQQWLPEFTGIEDLLDAIRRNDPAWLERLQHLPQLVQDAVGKIELTHEMQTQQLEELRALRQHLEKSRRADLVTIVIGFCLILLAGLVHSGVLHWQGSVQAETLVLGIIGMMLIVPRLLRL